MSRAASHGRPRRIAFYCPLKPPTDSVPSGDRTFARALMAACERLGHTVDLVSERRTAMRDPVAFGVTAAMAAAEVERAAAAFRPEPPDLVLTYHHYHKAPDLIGAPLARRLGCPHVVIEASRAPKHATGPWAEPFAAAEQVLADAAVVAAVTRHDLVCLAALRPDAVLFAPFIDTAPFAQTPRGGRGIVTAAMLREGRKAASVRVLADAVARLGTRLPGVAVTVAGDGPARAALEPLFPPGTFVGRLVQGALADCFAAADLFVWPAIDEPFGFVFLEAQAAGLPVIAGRARGVADVVAEGDSAILTDPHDAGAIADAMHSVLTDPLRRAAMASAARRFAATRNLEAGAVALADLIDRADP